jgi:tRNA-Thr(GGU) m(6)t(6)A37 methyltransferase TsaA
MEITKMEDSFQIFPIGMIKKRDKSVTIEIHHEYEDALLGLSQYSHILVFSWFHKSDTPEKRSTLRVHPRGNKANPLTGVFATRSPVRPNPISVYTCRILSIDGNVIHIEKIDALDGTPVIDIKPYVPRLDSVSEVKSLGG